jgi:ferredoxin-thioredoxin reductase catalytic subunit
MSESEDLLNRLDKEARAGGYLLNPDREDTLALCEGLATNTKRYGYQSCPCRMGEGKRDRDLDIVCPCDYRDPDLNEWGACYCALYVTKEWIDKTNERKVVPERRPTKDARLKMIADESAGSGQRMTGSNNAGTAAGAASAYADVRAGSEAPAGTTQGPVLMGKYPVWRCRVCGYLCARDEPPNVCPICKVTKDRFERFA